MPFASGICAFGACRIVYAENFVIISGFIVFIPYIYAFSIYKVFVFIKSGKIGKGLVQEINKLPDGSALPVRIFATPYMPKFPGYPIQRIESTP